MFSLREVKFKDVLDIDKLELSAEQVSCIVGPSGGGKTTLLKLLNNLVSVDQGQVLYQNKDVEAWDPIELRRKIIMLSQQPITFSNTIQEELEIAFKMICEDAPKKEQLIKILDQMQLNKKLSTKVERLSGGEKQRLSLARGLLLNPEVLLLDEPSSALDRDTEELVIKQLVKYAQKNNITLVMVTHSLNIAHQFGDEIIEIKGGKIAN